MPNNNRGRKTQNVLHSISNDGAIIPKATANPGPSNLGLERLNSRIGSFANPPNRSPFAKNRKSITNTVKLRFVSLGTGAIIHTGSSRSGSANVPVRKATDSSVDANADVDVEKKKEDDKDGGDKCSKKEDEQIYAADEKGVEDFGEPDEDDDNEGWDYRDFENGLEEDEVDYDGPFGPGYDDDDF